MQFSRITAAAVAFLSELLLLLYSLFLLCNHGVMCGIPINNELTTNTYSYLFLDDAFEKVYTSILTPSSFFLISKYTNPASTIASVDPRSASLETNRMPFQHSPSKQTKNLAYNFPFTNAISNYQISII